MRRLAAIVFLLTTILSACMAQFNTDRITAIGRNALYFEDYVLSIQYFNQVIRVKPYLAEPYQLRAIAKVQLGDYSSALTDVNRAITLNPFQHAFYYTRGFIHARTERIDLALQDYCQALFLSPDNRSYLLVRAGIYAQMDSMLLAERDLNHLLLREPKNGKNWSMMGMVLLEQHKDSMALTALDKAIYYGSMWAGDFANRGLVNYRLLHYPEALRDYNRALELEPGQHQLRYARGQLQLELGLYNRARADFDTLIVHYPTFMPSYYLAAEAMERIGIRDTAAQYRKTAQILETQHRAMNGSRMDSLRLMMMGVSPSQNSERQHTFSTSTADIVSQSNIVLSYYGPQSPTTQTTFFHLRVYDINQEKFLPATLRFTTQELALTTEMIDHHFHQISILTQQIDELRGGSMMAVSEPDERVKPRLAQLLFARAIEEALVQDYLSAIEDCTQSIRFSPKSDNIVQTFCRANWRFKLLEYQRSTGERTQASPIDFEIMNRDYDYIIQKQPDFTFAYYNKANMLVIQRQYRQAIELYTQAIEIDSDFAEAYFNRGLTYIHMDQTELALADLSKAGELGIAQAYNLITRLR